MRPHLVDDAGQAARAVRLSGAPGRSDRAALRGGSPPGPAAMVDPFAGRRQRRRSLVPARQRRPRARRAVEADARRAALARRRARRRACSRCPRRRRSARPPAIAGGWIDDALMRAADLVLVLPGIYVILALRGALPLVLSTSQVFAALVGVLGLVGWPGVARGVRGIVVTERREEYAEAAQGAWRRTPSRRDASSAAGDSRISPRPGDRPRARLHPGGGDGFLCRSWICGADAELGRHAAGRRLGSCGGRRALAPRPRRRHRHHRAGAAHGRTRPRWCPMGGTTS